MSFVVDLFVTIIVYLAFPSLYRAMMGKVDKKKGNIIALFNSIICCIIFIIIRGLMYGADYAVGSFLPAVLYFFIGRFILTVEINESKTNLSPVKKDNHSKEDFYYTCPKCNYQIFEDYKCCPHCGIELEFEDEIEKSKYCTNCGAELNAEFKVCPYCGKKRK